MGMSYSDWLAMYPDLPNRQVKVPVVDKSRIQCSPDEKHIVNPIELQEILNQAMEKVNQGRCFVRPSGTEDVVRIYAEAATQEETGV